MFLLFITLELTLLGLVKVSILHFTPEIQAISFITLGGFAVAIFQLMQGQSVNRSKFVSDYISKVYTD